MSGDSAADRYSGIISAKPSGADFEDAVSVLRAIAGLKPREDYVELMSYFLRYGYLPVSRSRESVEHAARDLAAAPWVGGQDLSQALKYFIEKGIVEFSSLGDFLEGSMALDFGEAPILRLSRTAAALDRLLGKALARTKADVERRAKMVRVTGWAHESIVRAQVEDAIMSAPPKATIKIAAYHGRTWLSPESGVSSLIPGLLKDRRAFKFQILAVDKRANATVREGASEKEHLAASAPGLGTLMRRLSQDYELGRDELARIDVRTYGKTSEDSLLRGLIVQNEDGTIYSCHATAWLFGHERAMYGRNIALDPGSNLAILCRDYFDRVFARSYPQVGLRKRSSWMLRKRWFEAVTLLVGPAACTVILGVWTWRFDAEQGATMGLGSCALAFILAGLGHLASLRTGRGSQT
jgi:hypothetical protein